MARNMPVMIVGRILEDLGAGGLDVLNEIILASIAMLKERPTYLGFFAIPTLCRVFSELGLCMSSLGLKSINRSLREKLA
ncbi:hypothetical protein BJ166DRAFT_593576 [Pestalotiopsis sp. NC0098]|nr:hypothetical protein BJ166DRAFT_593576 [Pestalotiopsis sp. NC0098]